MVLGPRMRERRTALGLSQEAVARKAGLSLNLVNKLENGVVTDPHYSTLVGLAGALGVAVDELVREPVPLAEASETGPSSAERTTYSFRGDAPQVTARQLREHRIKVNDSELVVLNQLLHVRAHPPTGTYVMGHVVRKDEDVVDARITMLLAYVVRFILTPEEAEAWGEASRRELVGAPA